MGARCVTVAVVGLLYGLSRPSSTPLYQGQNALPPLLSGQVPYFLFTVAVMNTSTYIASYLRFWKVRACTLAMRVRAPPFSTCGRPRPWERLVWPSANTHTACVCVM
jgi:hypothetical protein